MTRGLQPSEKKRQWRRKWKHIIPTYITHSCFLCAHVSILDFLRGSPWPDKCFCSFHFVRVSVCTWICQHALFSVRVFMPPICKFLFIHSSLIQTKRKGYYRFRGPLTDTLIFVHNISKPRGFCNFSSSIMVVHWIVVLEDTHQWWLSHTVIVTNGEVVGAKMTRLEVGPSHFVSCVSVDDSNVYNHE